MKTKQSKNHITLLGLVILSGIMAAAFFLTIRLGSEQKTLVAKVGDYEITAEHLLLRQQHTDLYYPGSGKPEVALAQLIQGYLAAMLMKQENAELDQATWIAEKERIDRQTRDPEALARLKAVYGNDEYSFLYVGILPDFAQSRLYKLYRSNPKFAEETRLATSAFLDEAEASPSDFMTIAERHGARTRQVKLDATKGFSPVEPDETATASRMRDLSPKSEQEMQIRAELEAQADSREVQAAAILHASLADVPEGGVYRNTLQGPEAYEGVRLVKRLDTNTAILEIATFVKPDFGTWFWSEASKTPVHIADESLKQRFIETVSWSKNLML
jgi:hypothetical protein